MIAITNEKLDSAANAYALDILGDEQYNSNPNAVESISENFKAGAGYLLKVISEDAEILDLTDADHG